jgi:FdhE protein
MGKLWNIDKIHVLAFNFALTQENEANLMKDGSESKSQRINEDVERLRALDYISKEHLDFFESITAAHDKAKDRMAKYEIYPAVSQETAEKMLFEGFPVLHLDHMKVRTRVLRPHLREICSILRTYEESKPSQVEVFSQPEKLDVKELITKAVSQNGDYLKSLSEKTGLDENTVKFIAVTLARPLFELVASEMRHGLSPDLWPKMWGKNFCPVCGSEPFMAKIRGGDNARILGCSLCGMEWKFDRVRCPFCENHDPSGKTLKYFYYHEESPHRVYVCDECKRYIKCVDERTMELGKEINFSVEDMATLYLDTLAREKGYASGWVMKGTVSKEGNSE